MIKIHNDLNNKQSNNIVTYAICWYIKLNCGSELKFTNHNSNIKIFLIDISKVKYKKLIINQGYLENIQIIDNIFKAKISTFFNQFNKKFTHTFSQNCRAKFCDKKCKLNAQDYTFYGKIEKIISKNSFFDIKRIEKDFYFNYGIVTFLTGINKGLSFEVKNFKNSITELILPSEFKLCEVEKYFIIAGCDKSFTTCSNKFKNSLNFRGEPYIYNALKTNLK